MSEAKEFVKQNIFDVHKSQALDYMLEAKNHLKDMIERLESLEKDAARYRWLRDENTDVALVLDKRTNYTPPSEDGLTGGYWDYEYRCGSELDSAIDTAMQFSQSEE